MAHARASIRQAIITALTGLTTTGARVGGRRLHTSEPADTPGISVIVAESPETWSGLMDHENGSVEARDLPVKIEGRVYALTGYEDTLDTISAEVETALQGNAALAALCSEVRLISTQVDVDGEGEKPVGLLTMEWLVTYRVNRTAPTTALP